MNLEEGSELYFEKNFYERFRALHSSPILLSVLERFGIEVFRRSSVLEGFEAFLEETDFRGGTCVEIGTFRGLTAAVLSKRFERVISVDVLDDPMKYEVAEFLGLNNVYFVNVRDNADKAKFISSPLEFDAAYSDGDHTNDSRSDFELLRRGGRVLFHEYWPAQPAVVSLVDSLESRGRVSRRGKFALWTE